MRGMEAFIPRTLEELNLTWPADLDHFSASSVKMAVRCPEQWRQRYVLGRKTPPAAALILGRADHKAIEHSLSQKMTSYTDLGSKEVMDKFVQVAEEEVERDGGFAEMEIKDGKDMVKGIAKKRQVFGEQKRSGATLAAAYNTQVARSLQPVAIEEPIELHVGLPVKITGYIDLVAAIGAPGKPPLDGAPLQIIDRKRAARRGVQAEWRLQADVYQLARPIPFSWHLSLHNNGTIVTPQDDEVLVNPVAPPERTILFFEQIIAEIGHLYQRYGPDAPWPTKGKLHPFACGYCGYRDRCWGWADEAPRIR